MSRRIFFPWLLLSGDLGDLRCILVHEGYTCLLRITLSQAFLIICHICREVAIVTNDETTPWNGDSDLKLSLLSRHRKYAIKDSKMNSNCRTMKAVWKDPVLLNGSCCLFRKPSVKILNAIQTCSSGDSFLKIVSILRLLLINNMSIIWVFFNGQMFKLCQSVPWKSMQQQSMIHTSLRAVRG